jgi:hypothetical protein
MTAQPVYGDARFVHRIGNAGQRRDLGERIVGWHGRRH